VGDPILASNITRRVDFALFMVDALENDELVHEAPAIVGRQTLLYVQMACFLASFLLGYAVITRDVWFRGEIVTVAGLAYAGYCLASRMVHSTAGIIAAVVSGILVLWIVASLLFGGLPSHPRLLAAILSTAGLLLIVPIALLRQRP
jgi:hypothetical protein